MSTDYISPKDFSEMKFCLLHRLVRDEAQPKFVTHLALVIWLIPLMIGCASSGRQIHDTQVKRIVIGETTKDEMISMFGNPLSQGYGTDGKMTMIWNYVYVGPFGLGMKQQNLAVLFDEAERVEKFNFVNGADNGVRFGP